MYNFYLPSASSTSVAILLPFYEKYSDGEDYKPKYIYTTLRGKQKIFML
jgi:hypothetical protein